MTGLDCNPDAWGSKRGVNNSKFIKDCLEHSAVSPKCHDHNDNSQPRVPAACLRDVLHRGTSAGFPFSCVRHPSYGTRGPCPYLPELRQVRQPFKLRLRLNYETRCWLVLPPAKSGHAGTDHVQVKRSA